MHDSPLASGFVDHPSCGKIPDNMETSVKPARITAKQARDGLSALLGYLDGKHDDASCIEAARALA